jgi:hypothetical protein
MTKLPDTYLLYGDTGSGKTSQLGELASWEYKRTGRITRLISADSGWDPIEPLIDQGIVEAWGIQYLPNPFPVLIKLSEGYWPEIRNGKLIMVSPTLSSTGYIVSNGKEISQYAIEGLSTIGNALLRDHVRNQRKLKDVSLSEFTLQVEVEEDGKTHMDSQKFGQADRSHYQQVQDFLLLDLVPRFATLPVERVMWTGHEAKGDDDVTGMKNSVLGPATVGKATVKKTGMKFGDTLHFAKHIDKLRKGGKIVMDTRGEPVQEILYRAYYEDHPDEELTRMVWPAKLSLPLSRVKEVHERFPGGYIPMELEGGMTKFFDLKYGPPSPESKEPK